MIRRVVAEAEHVPNGYGIAWQEDFSRVAVCYPIPLNWVAGWLRRLHWFLGVGPADPYMKAFNRGLQRGRDIEREWRTEAVAEAYGRGKSDGMLEALEHLRETFSK